MSDDNRFSLDDLRRVMEQQGIPRIPLAELQAMHEDNPRLIVGQNAVGDYFDAHPEFLSGERGVDGETDT